jgi:hypothetical protein
MGINEIMLASSPPHMALGITLHIKTYSKSFDVVGRHFSINF